MICSFDHALCYVELLISGICLGFSFAIDDVGEAGHRLQVLGEALNFQEPGVVARRHFRGKPVGARINQFHDVLVIG